MPNVLINDEVLETNVQDVNSINDLMNQLLNEHLGEHQVITNILINGKELPFSEEMMDQKVINFDSINFKVQSSIDLTFDAINSCSSYIDVTIKKILNLCEAYSKNDINMANQLFHEVVEIVDLYVKLISGIQVNLSASYPEKFQKTENIKKLEMHLLSIIKGLVPAKEKGDYAMLCDLLEYELIDNLKQWKISVIPQMKQIKPIV